MNTCEFDERNSIVENVSERWNASSESWENTTKGEKTYDSDGNIIKDSRYKWDAFSGNWTEEERAALIQAYLGAMQPNRQLPQNQDDLLQHIACCQLHLAMQCLGWAPNWSPPAEHKQDWMQQAVGLGDQLGRLQCGRQLVQ